MRTVSQNPAPLRTAGANPTAPYYPALDGVRAFAVLIVFIGHYTGQFFGFPAVAGVEIFFVLSGFLITGLLFDAQDKPHPYRNFYARRCLRILPLYYAVWSAFALLTPVIGIHWRPMTFLWPLHLGNYIVALAPFYPHLSGIYPLQLTYSLKSSPDHVRILDIGHFWSLCVEEQFYLVWPWVVFTVRKRRPLLYLCLAIFVLSPLVRIGLMRAFPISVGLINQITPLSLDGFLLGGLGALLLRGSSAATVQKAGPWLLWGAFALLLLARFANALFSLPGDPLALQARWLLGSGFPVMQIASLGLILACLNRRFWVARICSLSPVRALGRISYGFYVFHDIPHALYLHLGKVLKLPFACTVLLAFVATLGISTLSYFLLERPFLRLKTRFEH